MKILYVHGFGSQFDPSHPKIQALETLGEVVGVNVDYCKGFPTVFDTVMNKVIAEKIDLIVGTSMGGYMAANVAEAVGVPFVALNPATSPSKSLLKWKGNFSGNGGETHFLTESAINAYPDITTNGCGLIIVESGDEIIKADETIDKLSEYFWVERFTGGSHRFTHINKAMPFIEKHYKSSEVNYST